jgi:NCS1 family nucleobase:cation symporter-1
MVALVLGVAPVIPGFIHAVSTPGGAIANPGVFDVIYSYAWFVTFALSFVIYTLLMRTSPPDFNASSR